MKKTLNSIVLFLLLFIGQNAWGQSETTINSGSFNDGSITWTLSTVNGSTSNLHLNIEGSGDMPEFSRYNLCPWDDNASYIKTVTISDDITKISGGAFFGTSITSIDIPTKCTEIGARAFYKSKLKEIYIPASVTTIGANAFDYCSSLSLIHYDGSCTSSTGIAFTGVASKGKFIQKGTSSYAQVPSGWERYSHADQCHNGAWVASCGTKLFFYAQKSGAGVNYASSETLNSSESDKERYHPWRTGCYRWTSLEINKNIASIGAKEFIGYENEDVAKMGYTSMQTITVENGNQDFVVGADGALYDKAKTKVYLYPAKNSATEIEVPATVTDIRAGAFYGASNLQSITFLGTIKYIRAYAFAQASSLNHLYFATETAPTSTIASAFTGVASKGIVEADAQTDAFNTFTTSKVGENWEFYGGAVRAYISDGTLYVVGNGEYKIQSPDASWYSKKDDITKIVVKEGITNVGGDTFAGVFAGCTKVKEVTLNNNGSIGPAAFENCSALSRINIGPGVTMFQSSYFEWGGYTRRPFDDCSNLSIINVTDFAKFNEIINLDYLTNSEYGTCEEKILLVNGVANSYTGVFDPKDVKEINHDAIAYFENITKIKIPKTVTAIKDNNFSDCKYLTEITIPSTVTSVGYSAFENCTGLQTATLNNNGDIGVDAFKCCTALQTVALNNNGHIASGAFEDCTALKTVTLNNNGSVGPTAFGNCSALTRVNIGSGVTEFERSDMEWFGVTHIYRPFDGCSNLSIINTTDFVKFNDIKNLGFLTDSEYGTAAEKTLMVNGTTHDADDFFYIPEGVTTYNNAALRYFSNVMKVCLPSTMTTVDGFSNHKYLTNVTLPSSVTSVAAGTFFGCSALERIACPTITVPSVTDAIATNPSMIKLRVPKGYILLYRAADVWTDFYMEEANSYIYNVVLYGNESYNINSTALSGNEIVWNNTDVSAAQVKTTATGRWITASDFTTYDGSTSLPYRATTIMANLENGDLWQWNVTVNPNEAVLTDGNAYKNTEDYVVDKVSYTRTFSQAGAWQALYLPFAFDVAEYQSDFDIAEIYAICPTKDTNGDGVVDASDDKMFILSLLKTGMTQPNAPYMIRPKAAKEYTIISENCTLASAEIKEVEFSTSRTQYSVKGIYADDFYAVPGDNNIYVTASGGFGCAKTKNINVKPNRWILHEESKDYCGSASGSDSKLANFTIEVLGENLDETTAIKLINGETLSSDNNSVYNLNGMKVDATKSLPSGIYIVNGKKIFKK